MDIHEKYKIGHMLVRVPHWDLISSYLDHFGEIKVSVVKVLRLKSLLKSSDYPDVWMPTRNERFEIYDKRQASRGIKKGKAARKYGREQKKIRQEIIDGSASSVESRIRGRLSRRPNNPVYLSRGIERMQLDLDRLLSKFEIQAMQRRSRFAPNIQGKRSSLARQIDKKFAKLIHPAKRYRLIAEIMEWRVRYELGDNTPKKRIFTAESVRKYIERQGRK